MSQSSTPASQGPPLRQPLPVMPQRGFGQTSRKDAWWVPSLLTFLGLGAFVVYSTWAALQNEHYWVGQNGANYLSPFYSPELVGKSPHAMFGRQPSWWPSLIPFSPALLILWAPAFFRFTCYYYRGAYYKAFWADPISCAVGEPRKTYWGEHTLPLVLQNLHRYFVYIALIFLVFLAHDVWKALWFWGADGKEHFGLGLGTLVLALNTVLLSGYTLGCHSIRHLIGGMKDEISKSGCQKAYDCVSCLNRGHMKWAWCSLFGVGFADIYVRLCSMGIWSDWRIF